MIVLYPPTVQYMVREKRELAGHTQSELATLVNCSPSLISNIEKGRTRATPEFCESFTKAYGLPADLKLHLENMVDATGDKGRWSLHAPTAVQPSMITEQMQIALDRLVPHAAAWVDDRWRVLADNRAYRNAYPGLDESETILHWFVRHPSSRQVMLDHERELRLTIAWLRALMGLTGNPPWALEVLDDLSQDEEFARLWQLGEVAFGREDPFMHLYNPTIGEPYTLHVQLTRSGAHQPPMQHFLGVKMPYQGGDDLLKAAGRML